MSAAVPRILALLGSGETAPTMVTMHRDLVARFGATAPRAVLLDTPYGFQENVADISARAVEYFAQRVQLAIEVVGFPGPLAADPADRASRPSPAALARLRAAGLVFAGPGSPSYALSAWRASGVPEALSAKLVGGGIVVFSSAALLTLGRYTLPVYEIYKVGQPPRWLDGLDLFGRTGLPGACVVIPHFDNAEGGTHDTRYCYMGERRLAQLEALLPDEAWILGIDEHTACLLDLDAGAVSVTGRGAVTIRRRGKARRLPAGTRLAIADLADAAGEPSPGVDGPPGPAPGDASAETGASPAERAPLLAEVARLEHAFEAALALRRAGDAVTAILTLDRTIAEWASDSLQSDAPDRARAVLHALVYRLGEVAAEALRDSRVVLAPLVEPLVALRTALRAERAWAMADRLRDALVAGGIELRDTPAGTEWTLRRPRGAEPAGPERAAVPPRG